MLDNLFYILNTVREKILEGFILPGLGLSYWEFLCLLAIVGIVITVLVNSVQVGVGHSGRIENVKEREQARISVRQSSSKISKERQSALNSFDKYLDSKD